MSGVYISYTQADRDIAVNIASGLEQNGVEVWIDVSSIRAGEEWMAATTNAMNNASAILFIMTSKSLQSRWIYTELGSTKLKGKPIIPLKFDDSELPNILNGYLFI